jgi:hypothetical protein
MRGEVVEKVSKDEKVRVMFTFYLWQGKKRF